MQAIVSAQPTTIRLPTQPLRREKRKVDSLLNKLEQPFVFFQNLSENHSKRKRSFEEISRSVTTTAFRARVLAIIASRELLGYNILPLEECADLLNVIPFAEFRGMVEDIYNSCQESSFVLCVQQALNYMRQHWKNYSLERIRFLNAYPLVAFVPDVLDSENIQMVKRKIKEDLIKTENPGVLWKIRNMLIPCEVPEATDRKPILWKRFALSVCEDKSNLQLSMIDPTNPRKLANLEGLEPVIEQSLLAFVTHVSEMGVNVTRDMMGVQAFLLHGHVQANEVYGAVDWHRDQTAFGVPNYIMVLMLGDPYGDRGWQGGEFWCYKGNTLNGLPQDVVKLQTQFNQGIILKNDESFHFVSPVIAERSHSAARDILILDLYLNWNNVAIGLLTRDENDDG